MPNPSKRLREFKSKGSGFIEEKWRKERETAAISKAHCFVSSHVDETNQGETREKIFGPSKKLMRIFLGFGILEGCFSRLSHIRFGILEQFGLAERVMAVVGGG
ncbi:hypothetical protein ACLOJK_041935 [Asimina triloba]